MYKSKDQRYLEAVERNLANLERHVNRKYREKSLEQVAHKLGVRKGDVRFNTRIFAALQD